MKEDKVNKLCEELKEIMKDKKCIPDESLFRFEKEALCLICYDKKYMPVVAQVCAT